METFEAWDRAEKKMGTPEMVRLVQTVAQNTEHVVILRIRGGSTEIEMDVANSHILPHRLWDAPFQNYDTVLFRNCF